MSTYLIFIIKGYDKEENETLYNVIEYQIIADNYEDAVTKAKSIHKKNEYRLFTVVEKHNEHTG